MEFFFAQAYDPAVKQYGWSINQSLQQINGVAAVTVAPIQPRLDSLARLTELSVTWCIKLCAVPRY